MSYRRINDNDAEESQEPQQQDQGATLEIERATTLPSNYSKSNTFMIVLGFYSVFLSTHYPSVYLARSVSLSRSISRSLYLSISYLYPITHLCI